MLPSCWGLRVEREEEAGWWYRDGRRIWNKSDLCVMCYVLKRGEVHYCVMCYVLKRGEVHLCVMVCYVLGRGEVYLCVYVLCAWEG
jgi:hypothetical protein